MDIYRSAQGWVCKVDLAGVRQEDVCVELEGRRLRIVGLRRDLHLEAGWRQHSLEIAYSRFERLVDLPDEVRGAALQTSYREGMLLIHIIPGRGTR